MSIIVHQSIIKGLLVAHDCQNTMSNLMRAQTNILKPIAEDAINMNSIEYIEKLIELFPNSSERMDLITHLSKIKV